MLVHRRVRICLVRTTLNLLPSFARHLVVKIVIQAAHECSSRYAQPSNSSGYHHGIIPTQLYGDCKKNIIRIPIKQSVFNNPKKKQQAYLKVSKVAERTLRRVASVNLPGFFSTQKIWSRGKCGFFFATKPIG